MDMENKKIFRAEVVQVRNPNVLLQLLVSILFFIATTILLFGLFALIDGDDESWGIGDVQMWGGVGIIIGFGMMWGLMELNAKKIHYTFELSHKTLKITSSNIALKFALADLQLRDYHYNPKIKWLSDFVPISILSDKKASVHIFINKKDPFNEALHQVMDNVQEKTVVSYLRRYNRFRMEFEDGGRLYYGSRWGKHFSLFKYLMKPADGKKKQNLVDTAELVIPPVAFMEC